MSDFEQGLDAGREALRRFLAGQDDLDAMLSKIVSTATETVPGCDSASITMVKRGKPATPVFSDDIALALDETQYRMADGPCLAAIRHAGVEHYVTSGDGRWPELAKVAAERGVQAVLSVPLMSRDVAVGGLNLYSRTSASYDDEARATAALFADQLGVAAANAVVYVDAVDLAHQLREAMESRAVIEQAKGLLMAAEGCSPDDAFEILKQASQHQNRKLRAIAQEIVERRRAPRRNES